ncbi:MAG: hypothetical protein EXR72_17280 [Myxococcales bacterium]|nr:hypothetical protein [Myxococcales bacterium]
MHAAGLVAFAVLRFGLRLELGPEFDSNANRAETFARPPAVPPGEALPSPIASALLRTTASSTLAWVSGRNTLRLGATLGGKLFFAPAAAPQDVVVIQAAADDTLRAGETLLGIGADYYDATQRSDCAARTSTAYQAPVGATVAVPDASCRDFRAGGPRARVTALLGDFDLTADLGARAFRWKSDDSFSFDSLTAGLAAAGHFAAGGPQNENGNEQEWDLGVTARTELRTYHGLRLTSASDTGSPNAYHRLDADLLASAWLSFAGRLGLPLLASASYTFDHNFSTSYGLNYQRHLVVLKLGANLPWKLSATAKAQLTFTSYAEPLQLTSGTNIVPLTIEDESRDAYVFDLDRPLGVGFSLSLRYSLYRNGVSNATLGYLRHVASLGVAYRLR